MIVSLLGALLAGVLTTLAPCVLPLLPVIVGGSVVSSEKSLRPAAIIIASLGASIIAFTLLLKATTALIGIPPSVWQWLSGGLLILLGVVAVFPNLWERISSVLGLQARTARGLTSARQTSGPVGLMLTGAALGPVFTSCSPLYAYVIVTVLPAEPVAGLMLLFAYALGLCATLFAIAVGGQRVVKHTRWAADPHGWLRRGLGVVFIIIGVLVATGWMKDFETWVLANSPIAPWRIDQGFIPE